MLTTNVFIDQTWHDENLLWEPAEHNNISSLRIPEQRVWLPDTFLFNKSVHRHRQGRWVVWGCPGHPRAARLAARHLPLQQVSTIVIIHKQPAHAVLQLSFLPQQAIRLATSL